ncbi:MAG TPA: D-alanyl-D-alanine carboxypeptidase/D-alanyl-D-alanine-endopeptidase [Flavisolibacter sp.]|jgi:D-alanyl-D-alanine carboxypeptidase/D-alanyl-D-alanine-endopeptidase (penicillin-binding protein 4)|nr:D-alanyl-D-alanine carboxypeptidase/D-alanyl-D-alanine-endopeptidase [Flavisolibacter sp.]
MRTVTAFFLFGMLVASCGTSRQLQQAAQSSLLNDAALKTAHVGISIYEPATGKWWYNHQGDKYFVPASNTKILTAYAAMKYLGDSLVAARYAVDEEGRLRIFPSGDPTLLHPEFRHQPLFEKMKGFTTVLWSTDAWRDQRWGSGWSWNDYDAAYMAERSPLPVYGNVASFSLARDTLKVVPSTAPVSASAALGFNPATRYMETKLFTVDRGLDGDTFYLRPATTTFSKASIPLRMDAGLVSALLEDTLKAEVVPFSVAPGYSYAPQTAVLYSQPIDSLLKPLMHRSDNFFAEQALLMVSNQVLGYMRDAAIIDTILKTDLGDLPQKPRWADGSGLSRYNLFTPQSFVAILDKMKTEFGMNRIREIFPTGNEGTLSNFYKRDSTFLYAKTGTLSGVVALSGFLTTASGKELIFSVLVNNHQSTSVRIRRAVEAFLQKLRQNN